MEKTSQGQSSPPPQNEAPTQLEEYHATCIEAATVLNGGGVVYNDVDGLRDRLQKMERYFQQKLRQAYQAGGAGQL